MVRWEVILRHIGLILLFNAIWMFISFLISFFLKETSTIALIYSSFISFIFGIFPLIFFDPVSNINRYEGLAIVVLGWFIVCVIGAIPFILWGGEFTVVNSWFESVSGFTTTGSTILNDIESIPKGLLFWRSSTHWLGGMGIILFTLLILPASNASKFVLVRTEVSDIAKDNLQYQTTNILKILGVVYVGLTVLEIVFLSFAGMDLFDAVNHSFATVATGGFSTKNLSIASFNSITIEVIIMVFMVASGIHFGLIFAAVIRKNNRLFTSSVVRYYLLFITIGILLVAIKLYISDHYDWWSSLRYASFQVISLGTTTGFATEDTAHWPVFTQIILIYFTLQCAMVGSTSGGAKFDRFYIFFKSIYAQIRQLQHPNAVISIKVDGKTISDDLIKHTTVFILFYLLIIFITTLLLGALNVDIMTAFSASAATMGNVGPGFENVSSLGNFADIPSLGKVILTMNMLLGRLEIFGIISLFFKNFW